MDLNRISVKIRPRTAWEGIDLGFAMARQWFLPLWGLWWASALPLGLVIYFTFSTELWVAMVLSWWLKPLYEPPLLYWCSRALFGERLGFRDLAKQWHHIVWPRLLSNLTWRRLSPTRSFQAPVTLLEGLKGQARSSRISILGRGQHGGSWLTVVGIHFEIVLELSLIALLVIMLPEELRWLDLEGLLFTPGRLEEVLQFMVGLLAMSIIAPFYVAAGFALYLTRRSELEAWDIEINFRRLIGRMKDRRKLPGAAALLLGLTLLGGLLPSTDAVAAELTQEQARQAITEILEHEDFGEPGTDGYWKYVVKEDDDEDSDFDFDFDFEWLKSLGKWIEALLKGMDLAGEVILWLVGGLLAAYILYRIAKNRQWLLSGMGKSEQRPQAPVSLFGLDMAPESLPDDILAEVRRLLAQGEFRAALSLLYRSTLSQLVHEHHLELSDSYTEGECLRLVETSRPEEEIGFFRQLTQTWLRMAYGHLMPEPQKLEALCQQWDKVYRQQEPDRDA